MPTTVPGVGPELMLPYVDGTTDGSFCRPINRRILFESATAVLRAIPLQVAQFVGERESFALRKSEGEVGIGAIATKSQITQ